MRAELLGRREIAFIDVREEDEFARSHPLWAANLALSGLKLDAWSRIPRLRTPVVLYGSEDGVDARRAALRLRDLGYTHVRLLRGGLAAWTASGGELFEGLNVPSAAFRVWREHAVNPPAGGVRGGMEAEAPGQAIDHRVHRIDARTLVHWRSRDRSTDLSDVRPVERYITGHLPGFRSAPGDPLLRETVDAPDTVMQGRRLVARLQRDGTHFFESA